jgi:hypothetical protein
MPNQSIDHQVEIDQTVTPNVATTTTSLLLARGRSLVGWTYARTYMDLHYTLHKQRNDDPGDTSRHGQGVLVVLRMNQETHKLEGLAFIIVVLFYFFPVGINQSITQCHLVLKLGYALESCYNA